MSVRSDRRKGVGENICMCAAAVDNAHPVPFDPF